MHKSRLLRRYRLAYSATRVRLASGVTSIGANMELDRVIYAAQDVLPGLIEGILQSSVIK